MGWIANLFTGHKDNDKDKKNNDKDKKKSEKQELTPKEKANGAKTIQICLIIICPVIFGTYYLVKQAITANKKKKNEKTNKNGKPPSHIDNLIKAEQPTLQQNNLNSVKNSFENINTNKQNTNYEEQQYEEQQFSNKQHQKRNQKVRQQEYDEEDVEQENNYSQKKHKHYEQNNAFDDDEEEDVQSDHNRQQVNRNDSHHEDEEDDMEETYASTKNSFAKNENFTDNYSEINENQYNSSEQQSFTENKTNENELYNQSYDNINNVTEANNQRKNDYQSESVGYSADRGEVNYNNENYVDNTRNYQDWSRGNDPPQQYCQEDFNQQYENYPEKEINNQSVNRRLTKHYDLNTCNDARCKRCGGYRYH